MPIVFDEERSRRALQGENVTYRFLDREDTIEDTGEVWCGALGWSGNWKISGDHDAYGYLKVRHLVRQVGHEPVLLGARLVGRSDRGTVGGLGPARVGIYEILEMLRGRHPVEDEPVSGKALMRRGVKVRLEDELSSTLVEVTEQ